MIRVGVCECCGTAYNYDDAEVDLGVCGECNPADEDMIGIVDMEDFDARD
jgi:hypothetical protein